MFRSGGGLVLLIRLPIFEWKYRDMHLSNDPDTINQSLGLVAEGGL